MRLTIIGGAMALGLLMGCGGLDTSPEAVVKLEVRAETKEEAEAQALLQSMNAPAPQSNDTSSMAQQKCYFCVCSDGGCNCSEVFCQ